MTDDRLKVESAEVQRHGCPLPECVVARSSSEGMQLHFVTTHDLPPALAAELTAAFVLRWVKQNSPPSTPPY